jgi:Phosphate-selective porin O and P
MRFRVPPLALLAVVLAAPAAAQGGANGSAAPSVKLSGYIQGRETYQDGPGLTATINRARLAAAGSVTGGVSWRIQGEFRTGNVGTGKASVSLQDAYIRWTHEHLGVQVGQFKTPFTREFITSLAEVETADRSTVVDSLAPKRDIGVMADYTAAGRATFTAGLFNGNGQNVTANSDTTLLGVARVSVRVIPFLAVGINAASYFGDSTRYGGDVNLEAPWVVARGEWIGQHREAGGEDDEGWYALLASPVRPWLEPVVKLEWFNRPSVADGSQKNRAWTAGVNLFPWGRSTRFTLEYVSRKVGDPGIRRGLGLAQAQVVF